MSDFLAAVYIGRFNGAFQKAHLANVLHVLHPKAGEPSVRYIVFLLGSAQESLTYKNPMTFSERVKMIRSNFSEEDRSRLLFRPLNDTKSNDSWFLDARHQVSIALETVGQPIDEVAFYEKVPQIALIGVNKDESSWYLKGFPFWRTIGNDKPFTDDSGKLISATTVREAIFKTDDPQEGLESVRYLLPEGTYSFLKEYIKSQHYSRIRWDVRNSSEG